MKTKELIEKLKELDPSGEMEILASHNSGYDYNSLHFGFIIESHDVIQEYENEQKILFNDLKQGLGTN